MVTWTSLVVLSVAVVSTLSFPRPDAEYKIPTVGLGARAQYYVLHSDGSYKFGYDTADGIYEQAMAQAPGDVAGAFGYKDPTGADIKLEYTADDRGFIPSGAHLPVAPQVDFVVLTKAAPTVFDVSVPARGVAPAPATPVEVAQVRSSVDDDGSYSFSYDTSSSSRSESADARNSVTGRYSFVADDGINRRIDYVAGAETGYIAEGDSLPVGPSVPGAESGIPTGRILPVLSEEEANAFAATGTVGVPDSPVVPYTAPTAHGVAPAAGTEPASGTLGLTSSTANGVAPAASIKYSAPASSSPAGGHTSQLVGDVLVHQYSPTNGRKYGYSFSAVRR